MKKIIIVRHGDYSGSQLTEMGIKQVETLADFLSWINPEQSVMFSSSAPRAVHSVEILSERLQIPFVKNDKLWSDDDHDYDLDFAYELIKSQESEVVILVTHLEYAHYLPRVVCKRLFGNPRIMEGYNGLRKGQMVLIDQDDYEIFG